MFGFKVINRVKEFRNKNIHLVTLQNSEIVNHSEVSVLQINQEERVKCLWVHSLVARKISFISFSKCHIKDRLIPLRRSFSGSEEK